MLFIRLMPGWKRGRDFLFGLNVSSGSVISIVFGSLEAHNRAVLRIQRPVAEGAVFLDFDLLQVRKQSGRQVTGCSVRSDWFA